MFNLGIEGKKVVKYIKYVLYRDTYWVFTKQIWKSLDIISIMLKPIRISNNNNKPSYWLYELVSFCAWVYTLRVQRPWSNLLKSGNHLYTLINNDGPTANARTAYLYALESP